MEIEELLKSLADCDEMEAQDGMNITEEIKTFDDQKRVQSKLLGLNFKVTQFADGISINGKNYSFNFNTDDVDLKKVTNEIYDIVVECLRNADQRVENILKENKLYEV